MRDRRRYLMEQIFEEYGISIVLILVGSGVIAGLSQVLQMLAEV
jgi:hypothetical protein